jgi:hypothetical protein
VAAAIETESDPLSPRGAGRKVRRLPGGGWRITSCWGTANAFIALPKKPSTSSRTLWAQSRQGNSLPRRSESMSNARWLDSAPQNWHMPLPP